VIKIYEDFDKTERIAWKMETAKDEAAYQKERRIYELSQIAAEGKTYRLEEGSPPYQIPFRHLCNLIQIADGDVGKALSDLAAADNAPNKEQLAALRVRALCAKYWVENCAPEDFRFCLLPAGGRAALSSKEQEELRPLSDAEKNAVRILRDDVICNIENMADDKACAAAIYAAAEKAGVDGKTLFAAAYQSLIGKDQGPRLANFLRAIDKKRLLSILKTV